MSRYRIIKSVFGGSDVYDEDGNKVGYSLPSILGDGEDFYDEQGNPLGQSFEGAFGGEFFTGTNGSHGFFDPEFLSGQNLYLHGELTDRQKSPDFPDMSGFDPNFEPDDSGGDGFDF